MPYSFVFFVSLQKERLKLQKEYLESTHKLQEQSVKDQGKYGNGKVDVVLKDDSIDKMVFHLRN